MESRHRFNRLTGNALLKQLMEHGVRLGFLPETLTVGRRVQQPLLQLITLLRRKRTVKMAADKLFEMLVVHVADLG